MIIDHVPGVFFGRANKLSWEAAKELTKRARTPKYNLFGCHAVKCGVVNTKPYPGPSPDPDLDPTFYWRPISRSFTAFACRSLSWFACPNKTVSYVGYFKNDNDLLCLTFSTGNHPRNWTANTSMSLVEYLKATKYDKTVRPNFGSGEKRRRLTGYH